MGAEEIAEVVNRATGIPVAKMMQGEKDKLLHMEDKLRARGRPGRGHISRGQRHPALALGAVRDFGQVLQVKEQSRRQRTLLWRSG